MFPERGALNASFMLAKGLMREGFTVVYLTNSAYINYVSDQGFECVLFELEPFYNNLNNIYNDIRVSSTSRISKWMMTLKLLMQRNARLEEYLETAISEVVSTPVAGVLLDPIMMNCSIPFIKRSIPILHLNTTFAYTMNRFCLPVFSKDLPHARNNFITQCQVLWTWFQLIREVLVKDIKWNLRHGFVPTRTFNTGKSKINKYGHRTRWGEYGYRLRCPELVLAPRELDFMTIADDKKRCYVGSSVFANRNDGPFDIDAKGKSILYCSLGTYSQHCQLNTKVFYSVIDLIRHFPNWIAVIQIGNIQIPEDTLPSNVILKKMVPQMQMLEKATIALVHGGCSSLKECVFTGTPMILVPWNNDGFGNSARAVFHRLGVRIDINSISLLTLRKAFEEVLSNTEIQQSVRNMQRIFVKQENCDEGINYIKNYLTILNKEI